MVSKMCPILVLLGGGPSILVRYGGLYRKYSILKGSGIRTVGLLGGDRSIQLSYGGIFKFCPAADAVIG